MMVLDFTGNGRALPGQANAGSQDAFLRKYATNGNEVWTRQFGSSASDTAWGVAADASGVYIVGDAGDALPGQVSAGGEDAFVRKYDANGNEVWTHQFGSTIAGGCPEECDRARAVALDTSDVYVVGESGGTLPGQTNAGSFDAFVRKYDKNGNELWTRQFGSTGTDRAWGGALDASGVYVTGEAGSALPGQVSAGDTDPFLQKSDKNGNVAWTRQFGSSVADEAWSVAVDASGVVLAGYTDGALPGQASAGDADAFLRASGLAGFRPRAQPLARLTQTEVHVAERHC